MDDVNMVINQILYEIRRWVLIGFYPKRHIVVKKGLPWQWLWCGPTVVNNNVRLNEINVYFTFLVLVLIATDICQIMNTNYRQITWPMPRFMFSDSFSFECSAWELTCGNFFVGRVSNVDHFVYIFLNLEWFNRWSLTIQPKMKRTARNEWKKEDDKTPSERDTMNTKYVYVIVCKHLNKSRLTLKYKEERTRTKEKEREKISAWNIDEFIVVLFRWPWCDLARSMHREICARICLFGSSFSNEWK